MAKMLLKVGSKILAVNGKVLCDSGFPVTWNLSHVHTNDPLPRKMLEDDTIEADFTVDSGYLFPENIIVTGCEHEWDQGYLRIYNATDSVIVTINAVAETGYNITYNLTNVSVDYPDPAPTKIPEGGSITMSVGAYGGYKLPESITVTGCQYAWDSTEEQENLTIQNPTDNVTITIVGEAAQGYPITWNLTNCSADPEHATIPEEGEIASTITAENGYKLPGDIEVEGAEDYDWSPEDPAYQLHVYNPEGPVTITIEAEPATGYPITWNLTNCSADPELESITEDDDVSITITPDDGYTLPTDITVTGCESIWDPTSEEDQLNIYAAEGPVTITIAAE